MASEYEDELAVLDEQPDEQKQEAGIASLINRVVESLDQQERSTRDRMLRLWKYLELLWSGAGNYYWDHSAGQWRAVTQEDIATLASEADIDPTLISKTINIIRPYGESLAGVLTAGIPRVKYFPDDADKDEDIQAARGYTDVEKKIVDDNEIPLKLIQILVKLWNGGFAAVYNYTHEDKSYGTYKQPILEPKMFNQSSLICTNCGMEQMIGEEEITDQSAGTEKTEEELQSPAGDPEIDGPQIQNVPCESCGGAESPHIIFNDQVSRIVQTGEEDLPKSRQLLEVYGPLNVKISSLATKIEHVFWLILEEDVDVAFAKAHYPKYKDKIVSNAPSSIDVDRWSRHHQELSEDVLKEAATIRKVWLKPEAYDKLNPEDSAKLLQLYPDGILAIYCGDTFLEAKEENLDEHWTISLNPLYDKIQADPLGKALIGPHEATNDLFQLELDTVRFAVPITFADPANFDFEAFKQTRTLPGSVTPLKRPAGGKLGDSIAQTTTSTLPQGIEYLDTRLEKLIQFISGVLPPIFGGPASGSKTLGEYQEAKNQALQRLSIIWKVVSALYAKVMAKATKQYVENLKEDERFVRPHGKDGFINVWLRRSVLKGGKIGVVRSELSEQFPMTWAQISQRVMDLLALNNEVITAWFLHPENVELIYKVLGIDGLYIPGEDQRSKQLYEISQIIQMSIPQPDPITGEPMVMPQQQYPTEVTDNHQLHMEVIAAFLNSTVGIDIKEINPVAYQSIMAHYQLHNGQLQLQLAQQQALTEENDNNEDSEKKDSNSIGDVDA